MFYREKYTRLPHGLITELTEKQRKLRSQIKLQSQDAPITTIAGCDSAFLGDQILSVFVVLSFPDLQELEVKHHLAPVMLPYIPGFLAFREAPNLVSTFNLLKIKPDIIMVDGHGIMHPRRLGIATHLGILLNTPTFGVAKKKLVGTFFPPEKNKGSTSPVTDKGETLGVALTSKDKVKPIFISPGHLCDLDTALDLTLKTLKRHKLPEPTRLADKYSKELKLGIP
jgi:deoxyribonuclease V